MTFFSALTCQSPTAPHECLPNGSLCLYVLSLKAGCKLHLNKPIYQGEQVPSETRNSTLRWHWWGLLPIFPEADLNLCHSPSHLVLKFIVKMEPPDINSLTLLFSESVKIFVLSSSYKLSPLHPHSPRGHAELPPIKGESLHLQHGSQPLLDPQRSAMPSLPTPCLSGLST